MDRAFKQISSLSNRQPFARRQSGIVLFIALVTMVLLMLAALATLRSVDSTTMMTGNLAFREATTQVSDYGTENARRWLIANAASLGNDNLGAGYHASIAATFNPKAQANSYWTGEAVMMLPTDTLQVGTIPQGYTVYYTIHRMCSTTGSNASCFNVQGGRVGLEDAGVPSYGNQPVEGVATPYYQVTTKVVGPRNSVSYVQTLIY